MTNKIIEEKYSDNVPLPICVVDGNGKVKSVNSKIGEVFLYDEIVGSDIFALTGISKELLQSAAETGEQPVFRGAGKTFKISVADAGDGDGSTILYFTDISDFEEMQERYKKEQACYAIENVDN